MSQYLGFGNGTDGAATLSGTDAPVDSSCSGTSGATALSATNASFAANQMILIHQSRGTGVGGWEVNQIASYVAGTITTLLPLVQTYTDSGASQAQVMKLPQYNSVTISSSLLGKSWNGDVGGIFGFLCNGKTTISNTLNVNGCGYRFGSAGSGGSDANTGEGTVDAQLVQTAANGSGGGGGQRGPDGGHIEGGHGGGGGGGGELGGNAGSGKNTAVAGAAGGAGGNSSLTTGTFGGGGGGGGQQNSGSPAGTNGGNGSGFIFIFTKVLEVTGAIQAIGDSTGGNSTGAGCGGGGGGGSIFIKAINATIGSSLITATGGTGGTSTGAFGGKGADGGNGTIRIEACTLSGTSNPSASTQLGGFNFCGVKHGVL